MEDRTDNLEQNKTVMNLPLIELGVTQLIALLDVARKHGSRAEAVMALNYMAAIEKSFSEQQTKAAEALEQNEKPESSKKAIKPSKMNDTEKSS